MPIFAGTWLGTFLKLGQIAPIMTRKQLLRIWVLILLDIEIRY